MTTKKIKELDIPAGKQSGEYRVVMSFSVPVPERDLNNVSVRLTDQNGNVLWGSYLITTSPTGDIVATFSHTNLTKLILWRYLSNAYGVTSHKFQVYWSPPIIKKTVTIECNKDANIYVNGELKYTPIIGRLSKTLRELRV